MSNNAADITLDDIISQSEAARLRGVSREAIRNLIDRGRLRGVTIGGRLCVYRSEVLAFEPDKGGRPPKPKDENAGKASKKRGGK